MLPQSILHNILNNTGISKPRSKTNISGRSQNTSHKKSQFDKDEDSFEQFHPKEKEQAEIPKILFKENVSLAVPEDSDMVLAILRKFNRSKEELNFVKKSIENMDLWKSQDNNIFNQGNNLTNTIFSHLKVQTYSKGEIVFNYGKKSYSELVGLLNFIIKIKLGDVGTVYYIVAKGTFSCLIPKSKQDQKHTNQILLEEKRKALKQQQKIQHQTSLNHIPGFQTNPYEELIAIKRYIKPSDKSIGSSEIIEGRNNLEFSDDNHIIDLGHKNKILKEFQDENIDEDRIYKCYYPNFMKVKTYQPGESFGEIALLTQQKERKATIISRDDGVLITLDKSKFERILSICKELKIQKNLTFLQKFSFLHELGPSNLLSLLHCTQIVTFQKSCIIYKEGDKAENIFFIKSGEVTLTKMGELIDDSMIEQRQKELAENENLNLNFVKKQQAIQQSKTRVSLVVYKENCFFGEEEIMNSKDIRETRAEVNSVDAELFIITKSVKQHRNNSAYSQFYLKKLLDYLKSSNVYDLLVKEYNIKKKWRSQQYKNILNLKLDTNNQFNIYKKQLQSKEYKQACQDKMNEQFYHSEGNCSQNSQRNISPSPYLISKARYKQNELKKGYLSLDNSPIQPKMGNFIDPPDSISVGSTQSKSTKDKKSAFINSLKVQFNLNRKTEDSKYTEGAQDNSSYDSNQIRSPLGTNTEGGSPLPSLDNRDDSKSKEPLTLEKRKENMKRVLQFQEDYFKVNDSEKISSPIFQPFRIPPELSAVSLNQVLEERCQYKQKMLDYWHQKGKASNFMVVLDPNQKKLQELDIYKMKKERSQPIFQKISHKQLIKHKPTSSASPLPSAKNIQQEKIQSNENLPKYFMGNKQQNYDEVNSGLPVPKIKEEPNNLNDTSFEEIVPPLNLQEKKISAGFSQQKANNADEDQYMLNTYLSPQSTKQLKPNTQNKNIIFKSSQSQQFFDDQNSYFHSKAGSKKPLTDTSDSKSYTQLTGGGQLFSENSRLVNNFNIISGKSQHQTSYSSMIFQSQKQDSQRHLQSSSRTYRQFSQSNLLGEQLFHSSRGQKCQLLSDSQQQTHQQLLQFNNLEVKHINIMQKSVDSKVGGTKSQQFTDVFSTPQRNLTRKHSNVSVKSIKNGQINLHQPTNLQQLICKFDNPKPAPKTHCEIDNENGKQKTQLNHMEEKLKNLEKEVKTINLKKIFSNTNQQKLFKQLHQTGYKEQPQNKIITSLPTPPVNNPINNSDSPSTTIINRKSLSYSSKKYHLQYKTYINAAAGNQVTGSSPENPKLEPASFLKATQITVVKQKQQLSNA